MSFYNPTKNPIPFYKLEGEVWTNYKPKWFKNSIQFNSQKPLQFPGLRYFQLRVSDSVQSQIDVTAANLRKVSDNSVVSAAISRTLFVDQKNNKKYVGMEVTLGSGLVGDDYYISVETVYGYYYSEIFKVCNTQNDTIGIIWASSKNRVGDLIYPGNFRNYINVDAEIVPAEPQIEQETEENGMGEETPTLQILTQAFKLSFIAPNYLAQALSALELHDEFQFINRPYGEFEEDFNKDIKKVTTVVTPEENGKFSFVEITYVEETILHTSCIDDIFAANNPPVAEIVWNDTLTAEDRACNNTGSCTQTLKYTENTYDPDNNLDYLEWEKSADDGVNWTSLGIAAGDTLEVTESDDDLYWYRLKAVDTYGAVGYSNVLKMEVSNAPYFSEVSLVSNSIYPGGAVYDTFKINGQVSQNIKMQLKVLQTYGRGFNLQIFSDENLVLDWDGGPVGTTQILNLTLDGAGIRNMRAALTLDGCNGEPSVYADVEIRLFKNDNTNLSNNQLVLKRITYCTLGGGNINIDLPPGWLP